ncbi:hypothetical protein TNCT6_15570 [Streptomyces sp. 6-11-2]|nr:hypothetical protein TNCT6_15570 [Streptomyces sp. 6-11-2]
MRRLRRVVAVRGATRLGGTPIVILVSAVSGHDGHGAGPLGVMRIVRGTRRGGPRDGSLMGG